MRTLKKIEDIFVNKTEDFAIYIITGDPFVPQI
jgi:hypothetical protein